MGLYNAHLLEVLYELKLPIWLESSLQIKQAGGMQRGKTDKVDAQRIAQYARTDFHSTFELCCNKNSKWQYLAC